MPIHEYYYARILRCVYAAREIFLSPMPCYGPRMLIRRDESLLLIIDMQERLAPAIEGGGQLVQRAEPVSYTHLTLPTIYSV